MADNSAIDTSATVDANNSMQTGDDAEVEEMKRQVKQIEEETAKLIEMQANLEKQQSEAQEEIDSRSIYVGGVSQPIFSSSHLENLRLITVLRRKSCRLISSPVEQSIALQSCATNGLGSQRGIIKEPFVIFNIYF